MTHKGLLQQALLLFTLATPTAAMAQTTHVVTVGDNFFSPANLTIDVGDTVRWENAAGGNSHNVTANDASFESVTAQEFTFEVTFDTEGSTDYRCTIHPSQMQGTITVQGAAPPPEADLALTEVSAPSGSFAQGATISVDAEVQNVGDAASADFSIDFYASTNNDISSQDTLLGTQNRSGLPAGENSSGPIDLTIPNDLSPGTYFIGAIIDINDADNGNDSNFDDEPLTVTEAGGGGGDFMINAGLNDSWYNPDTGGQGFFITVFPDIEMMFLSWFTYDVERPPQDVTAMLGDPGHRWLTAFGPYAGDTAMLDIEITVGGTFDSPEPDPTQSNDGTMTVIFSGCDAGEVQYNIPSLALSGTVPIQRLADDNIPLCESLASP